MAPESEEEQRPPLLRADVSHFEATSPAALPSTQVVPLTSNPGSSTSQVPPGTFSALQSQISSLRADRDAVKSKLNQVCQMLESERMQVVHVARNNLQQSTRARVSTENQLKETAGELAHAQRTIAALEAQLTEASAPPSLSSLSDLSHQGGSMPDTPNRSDSSCGSMTDMRSDATTPAAMTQEAEDELHWLRAENQLLKGTKQQLLAAHEQQLQSAIARETSRRFPDLRTQKVVPLTVGKFVKLNEDEYGWDCARIAEQLPAGRVRVRWMYRPSAVCCNSSCVEPWNAEALWGESDSGVHFGPCKDSSCTHRVEPLLQPSGLERIMTDHTDIVAVESLLGEATLGSDVLVLRFVRFASALPQPIETFSAEVHSEERLKHEPNFRAA